MPRDSEPAPSVPLQPIGQWLRETHKRESPLLGLSQRMPPSNLQAEQSLLGALLANNKAFERVAEIVQPRHFADPVHARIFQAIAERILDGGVADAVSLRHILDASGELEAVGGTEYLAQLLTAMVGIVNAPEYAQVIVDTWKRRRLIEIGETLVHGAFGDPHPADDQVQEAERMLADLAAENKRAARTVTGGQAIAAAVRIAEEAHRTGRAPGIMFGLPTIDRALDGCLTPGTLTLLAGLPGSGKTALAGQMGKALGMRAAAEALADGKTWDQAARAPGLCLISMEMSAEQLGLRLCADEAGMTVTDLRKGRLDLESTLRLSAAMERTRFMAFRIQDMRRTPWRLLAPRIRLMLQRQAEVIVAIDHLLVLGEAPGAVNGKSRGGEMNASYVAWVTGQLKDLAEELGIAIVALTHTPRPQFGEPMRRPRASDVKWAGEGDADNVVFVHRPIMLMDSQPPARATRESDENFARRRERWHSERDELAEVAEIVVAKQRMGPGGVFRMRWDGKTAALREWGAASSEIPEWVMEQT